MEIQKIWIAEGTLQRKAELEESGPQTSDYTTELQ